MPSAWMKPGRYNQRQQTPKLNDLLPLKKFKPGVFYELRAIGAPFTYAEHWFKVLNKDGQPSPRRKLCIGYVDETGEFTGKCPYCEILGVQGKVATLQNFIDRKLERQMPRDLPPVVKAESKLKAIVNDSKGEWYLKEKDSESWTPVEPVRLPNSPCQDIANMVGSNTRPNKDGEQIPQPPEHPKYGFDIKIKHDPKASPAKQYYVEKMGPTKLDDAALDYLIFKLDVEVPETYAEAKKEADYFADKLVDESGGEGDDKPARGAAGGRTAKTGPLADLDAEDGDGTSFDPPDEDDQEEKPRRGAKPSSRRVEPEDDQEEERLRKPASRRAEPQEQEEEKPRRSAKPKPKVEDQEDDEPIPPRRGSKPVARDDDQEEEKPRRSAKPSSRRAEPQEQEEERPRRSAKPSSRRAEPDDDQEDNGDLDL